MKILILGGTVFLGRHLVQAAQAQGHIVTLFNRGTHGNAFPGIETLRGDRSGNLSALAGQRWDAVIDTCGYTPRRVQACAELLFPSVAHYTLISTLSVYSEATAENIDEDTRVDPVSPGRLDELEAVVPAGHNTAACYGEAYGPLKASCELVVSEVMRGRALHVRPGLLVGPYDYTDRFTYWPTRMARGGHVLAPGNPLRQRQLIDVRDVAEWTIRMIEEARCGVFNVTGPEMPVSMERILAECETVANSNCKLSWVSDEFLVESGVIPWREMPLWVPARMERPAFFALKCRKAAAAGLRFRPLSETIRDTLAWDNARSPDLVRHAGLSAGREAELLEAWGRQHAAMS